MNDHFQKPSRDKQGLLSFIFQPPLEAETLAVQSLATHWSPRRVTVSALCGMPASA
jgi:hypothetical protein